MGLPSGTLWLDRLVGAQSPTSPGLYYQWGSIKGHTATEGYDFNLNAYREQGLDTISSNLSESQDAARTFYGPSAKMPSVAQMEELLQYTSKQAVQPNSYRFTSLRNGESIIVYCGGYIKDSILEHPSLIRSWINGYLDDTKASSLHSNDNGDILISIGTQRIRGLCIMAVHS